MTALVMAKTVRSPERHADPLRAMNPAKRRRSSSPGLPPAGSSQHPTAPPRSRSGLLRPGSVSPPDVRAAAGRPPTASPSHPHLPAPIPSAMAGPSSGTPFPPPFASGSGGPPPSGSGWQSSWPNNRGIRRSMDARSPLSESTSPKMEGIDEEMVVFTRDTTGRAPRSMMACSRCRRQKMKCDGPTQIPCRGCRQAGVDCVFEPRSRPKSISALPSRPPPFFTGAISGPLGGRPGTPTGPPFYPSSAAPAPPVTSRPPPEAYALRHAREPMPPPPGTSISTITSGFRGPSPPIGPGPGPPPGSATVLLGPPPGAFGPHGQVQPFSAPPGAAGVSYETRLRAMEAAYQNLAGLPAAIAAIQNTLTHISRTQEAQGLQPPLQAPVGGDISPMQLRARVVNVDIPLQIVESYRTRGWPLTPWLVGLRESPGLPGLVIDYLGKQTLHLDVGIRECERATDAARNEVGRLTSEGVEWNCDEIRSLSVFATWTNEPAMAAMTLAHARSLGLDKVKSGRRTHDEWREWIHLAIMDPMFHVPDYLSPITKETYGPGWRDRLKDTSMFDETVRDRDYTLSAWLEYAELLAEILNAQQSARDEEPDDTMSVSDRLGRPASRASVTSAQPSITSVAGVISGPLPNPAADAEARREREAQQRKALDVWRMYGGKLDAWVRVLSARTDPILSLYYHYAVLFTATPIFLASQTVWEDMVTVQEGYQQLERARDGAFAVLRALGSPELTRTLTYSFALYRPIISLALLHLLHLALILPQAPLVSLEEIADVFRATHASLEMAQPLVLQTTQAGMRDAAPRASRPGVPGTAGSAPPITFGLLSEIVEFGLDRGKIMLAVEPGRRAWKLLLGGNY